MSPTTNEVVAVVGLGYVGLPLVVEFGKQMRTIGLDIDSSKVESCYNGIDPSKEISEQDMRAALYSEYRFAPKVLAEADYILVAVPTPIDSLHNPDLTPLIEASKTIGLHMKKGAIIIYESTVYPGATEEVCIPILESFSCTRWKRDFFVGYSPERINPGDHKHKLVNVVKVISGDTPATLEKVASLYEKVVKVGVHRCSSIKVAEACKVIENTQRDLNIALMNELSIIFDKIGIDTAEVLDAAGSKWNFLNFKPGLVGGHCIGVDPYYLTYKAETLGYTPQVILAGRRINDGMGKFIAQQAIKQIIVSDSLVKGAKVNILGLTFKEDCSDLRNSKVVDIIKELQSYNVEVFVHDPKADPEEALRIYGVSLIAWNDLPRANAIIAAVAHEEFFKLTIEDLCRKLVYGGSIIDVKSMFSATELRAAGIVVWRL
jgi:UDP-N-acetyl-D-galactosamine dehydrogenase